MNPSVVLYLQRIQERTDVVRSEVDSLTVDLKSTSEIPEEFPEKILSESSRDRLYKVLSDVHEPLGQTYAQVKYDLEDIGRTSWGGTAHEIRELMATLLRIMAPDVEVISQKWYKQEPGTNGPTQKQRAKYIMIKNHGGSSARAVMAEIELVDKKASLIRETYNRASDAAHRLKGRTEAKRLFRYFEAFAYDLLDLD